MLLSQPWCPCTMRSEFSHSVKKSVNTLKDSKKRKEKYQGLEGQLRAGDCSRLMQRVILWILDQEEDSERTALRHSVKFMVSVADG